MKSVVLLSGGIDSATCLWIARSRGPVTALTVDYGQHAAEMERKISVSLCAMSNTSHRHIDVKGISELSSSAITGSGDASVAVNAIVPGRNALLVSVAASFAAKVGADTVWIGCNKTDADNFPDCTEDFLSKLNEAVWAGYKIKLMYPLALLSKKQVVAKAKELWVPLGTTSSCYYGTACGDCSACKIRKEAMED